ncbi:PTS sugar transporter subunit IIA [Rudaeicoccus suwonensis]|uniref:PTS system N-acetylglucosamine-specific IIA component n=1 Tax=Rudaeicoccus suwonensis TaxID=657409 RepID=A0A561E3D2_9MICO|nr:PTS glucose transporter subunit IIA [Rudaeicoccus suwonensis]TWE10117.1 PTS system N-acetylglucosamine-specific IIA component [Rudaeicoccus suwonensis]
MTTRRLDLLAPYDGRVIPLSRVPDPVLSTAVLGASVAIDPVRRAGEVLSPVTGHVAVAHHHAFVVQPDAGPAALVHLGIDTVRLNGRGFEGLATVDDQVAAGAPVIRWDPGVVAARGFSPLIVLVLLDTPTAELTTASSSAAAGQLLARFD